MTRAAVTMSRIPVRALLREAQVTPRRIALSIGTGTLALGSAVGLAAIAAWLIAKAAQMPSPADLAVAAVAVRTFGIGRGVFRYLERLVSHETALSGVVALRAGTYDRVAASGASTVLSLKRGDIVARMGADIDAMGDAVVRSIVPLGVAATVSLLSVVIVTACLPVAGLALALCLLAAAALSGLATWRASRLAADAGSKAATRIATATLEAIDGAIENKVWGTADAAAAELKEAGIDAELAAEVAARPSGWSAAALQAAQGVALIASVWLAVEAARSGGLAPTAAAVVALLPLSAFEAVSAVPGASLQAFRSAVAARRVLAIAPAAPAASSPAVSTEAGADPADAVATESAPFESVSLEALSAAWPGMTPTVPVTATLSPGGALGIVGRSGIGKTTLLLTIAGALDPHSGKALINGVPSGAHTLGSVIAVTPEDAHVFGTSVLENLRVAKGDLTEAQALAALSAVGLSPWLDAQPDGLDTQIGSGGHTVSGGERRRLLLARALVADAPVHLIDEPAEHLDADGVDALRALVAAMKAARKAVVIVTHDLGILDVVEEVISLDVD